MKASFEWILSPFTVFQSHLSFSRARMFFSHFLFLFFFLFSSDAERNAVRCNPEYYTFYFSKACSWEHRNVFYGKHSFWPNGGINCIVDLDCTYGATYYLILGLMKGLHTYASINKLFNQPMMGGVCVIYWLNVCCVMERHYLMRVVWPMEAQFGAQQRDWKAMCDCPALGLTSRFQVQCRMVPAKAVPSACVD